MKTHHGIRQVVVTQARESCALNCFPHCLCFFAEIVRYFQVPFQLVRFRQFARHARRFAFVAFGWLIELCQYKNLLQIGTASGVSGTAPAYIMAPGRLVT